MLLSIQALQLNCLYGCRCRCCCWRLFLCARAHIKYASKKISAPSQLSISRLQRNFAGCCIELLAGRNEMLRRGYAHNRWQPFFDKHNTVFASQIARLRYSTKSGYVWIGAGLSYQNFAHTVLLLARPASTSCPCTGTEGQLQLSADDHCLDGHYWVCSPLQASTHPCLDGQDAFHNGTSWKVIEARPIAQTGRCNRCRMVATQHRAYMLTPQAIVCKRMVHVQVLLQQAWPHATRAPSLQTFLAPSRGGPLHV